MFLCTELLLVICVMIMASVTSWNYANISSWSASCKKLLQSPINIDTKNMQKKEQGPGTLNFSGFEPTVEKNFTLINNGHTVSLLLTSETYLDYLVRSGEIRGQYKAHELHFHWGSSDSKGSEHTKNGKAFPLELHVVFYHTQYEEFEVAVRSVDGLANFAIWFHVSFRDNLSLKPILEKLEQVKYFGDTVAVETFDLLTLFPANKKEYYRYYGSLAVPPCYQTVKWTVFANTLPVSRRQLKAFRKVFFTKRGEEEVPMVNNFRPVQPLGNRTVFING